MIVDRPQWSLFDRDRAEDIIIIDRLLTCLHNDSLDDIHVLETGVCDGGSTALFLLHPHVSHVTSFTYHHDKNCPQARPPELAGRWARAIVGATPRWKLVETDSTVANWREHLPFGAEYFDAIFIDGNHMDPHVRIDAEKAVEIVSRKGFILFDDFEEAPVQRAAERTAHLLNVPNVVRLTHKLGVVFAPSWQLP